MARNKKTSALIYAVLSELMDRGAMSSSIVTSTISELLDDILSKHDAKHPNTHYLADYLLRQRLIEASNRGDGSKEINLTVGGWRRIQQYKIAHIEIKHKGKWDGTWHMVAFDIPEQYKSHRNALTKHLKRLGLWQFQRSSWVYPYECEEEVMLLAHMYGIEPYVTYSQITRTTAEVKLYQHFKSLIKNESTVASSPQALE